MSSAEKREALRVSCTYPVRIYGQGRQMTARLLDVSRTGLRMHLTMTELLDRESGSLLAVADAVQKVLGAAFNADLHYEMLGPLVRKSMSPVRLGYLDDGPEALELGCVFEQALTDEETGMLGVGLPPVGVTAAKEFRHVPAPKRRGDEDEKVANEPMPTEFVGYLHPGENADALPLEGSTSGLHAGDAVLRVEGTAFADADLLAVAPLTSILAEQFGAAPSLEVLDGLRMIWKGPVEIRTVELDGGPGADVRVHLRERVLVQ